MSLLLCLAASAFAVDQYVESFDSPGNPGQPFPLTPDYWYLDTSENPAENWSSIAPGNGSAFLTVNATDVDNDEGALALVLGTLTPGRSIHVRMRGAVIPGYATQLYTISNDNLRDTFDSIRIDLFADDVFGVDGEHAYEDWTDARFTVWDDADSSSEWPTLGNASAPILDAGGNAVSHHADSEWHTYSIDWYADHVDFYIDGVLQSSVVGAPDAESELVLGLRDLSDAGLNDANGPHVPWSGSRSVEVDYVRIGRNGDADGPDGFVPPRPNLSANGLQGSVNLNHGDPVRLLLDIEASVLVDYPVDLWVRAEGPGPVPFWWQPGTGWVASATPLRAGGGPLRDTRFRLLSPSQVLPRGTFDIVAAIDDVGGGNDAAWSEGIQLIVQ